jgi:hypothetical protein
MNPLLDILATAGGSIVLAAFFLWLLVTAARQEAQGDGAQAPTRSQPRRLASGPTRRIGKGDYAHG